LEQRKRHMPALAGIRVLDLTRLLPGPYGTMILADDGAEVIKIEEPGSGDPLRDLQTDLEGVAELFAIINRGKRSVTLNLRSETGVALFHKLLATADVLVEGFRPGVMQRLGLGYESLAARYPRLIYCSISGFGQTGERRQLPGHDLNYLGWAGLLADAAAVLPPTLLVDLQAGQCAAFGIVRALLERTVTGTGRYVDIDMTRAAGLFLLPWVGVRASHSGSRPWFRGGLACYNVYRTSDGKPITLAALEEKFWRTFCEVVDRPDLADGHRRPERQEMLWREVAAIVGQHPEAYWLAISNEHDVCIGPVRSPAEALADASLRDAGWPDPFPTSVPRSAAPELGADTRNVLVDELGCDPAEITRAQENGDV